MASRYEKNDDGSVTVHKTSAVGLTEVEWCGDTCANASICHEFEDCDGESNFVPWTDAGKSNGQ